MKMPLFSSIYRHPAVKKTMRRAVTGASSAVFGAHAFSEDQFNRLETALNRIAEAIEKQTKDDPNVSPCADRKNDAFSVCPETYTERAMADLRSPWVRETDRT